MKLISFVMLICLTQVSAKVKGQDIAVDLFLQNVTVEQAVNQLEKQLNQKFFFSREKVDINRRIDVSLSKANIDELVKQVFGENFRYWIEDNVIVVSPAKVVPQTVERLMLAGSVKDKGGNPLPGVTVLLKGTTLGSTTNAAGEFAFSVPKSENITLVFSFIGMKKQEVPYKGQKTWNIVMEEEASQMDEVVVTGVFTKARESYTGAVTTITAQELKKFGNRNILSSIRNIDPSFNILESNEYGSDPNRLPDIQIRGASSMGVDMRNLQDNMTGETNLPLFILDGFEISLTKVMDMDDSVIESVTLLKDASATAMYGARGANGVVVLTSSKPEAGRLRVTYRGNLNLEAPDLTSYDLLNAREKLNYEVAAGIFNDMNADRNQQLKELYNQRLIAVERGVDTYWLRYPVRTGTGHRHSLRIDGGDDHFKYAATVGYNAIRGAMKGSDRNTISGDIMLMYKYKNFTFQNDLSLTINKNTNSPYGTFSDYTQMNAYWEPFDQNGKPVKVMLDAFGRYVTSPLYNAYLPSKDEAKYTNIQDNLSIEWKIRPELFIRGRLTLMQETGRSDKYLSKDNTRFSQYQDDDLSRRGSYNYGTTDKFRYEADITLNYNKLFREKHALYAGMSYNFAETKEESNAFAAEGFPASNLDFIGMATAYAKNGKPTASESISRRLGVIANVNYTYDRRYFVDLSGKIEGSSQFGSNSRTAPFWSIGWGWNIHNENFITNKDVINNMRLRVSYGVTGSQNFSSYQAMTTFKYVGTETYRSWAGSQVIAMGNPDLKWQQTGQWNVGMDIQLFHNRVRLNADVYNKLTDNLLSDITIPVSSGFSSYKANVGKTRNRGVELNAMAFIVRNTAKEITWSVNGTLAHNKNEILEISNSLEALNERLNKMVGASPSFLYVEGQSMSTIFAVKSLGIDPGNGKEIFVKKDGTLSYQWNVNDKVPCGVTDPKIFGNLNTIFRYKDITFNASFSYRVGGAVYNQTMIDKVENVDPWQNADRRVFYGRWQNIGDRVYFKDIKDKSTTYASSRFVQKENSLTCRSLNVTWTIDEAWTKKNLRMDYLSVGVYAEDVFQISTIKQERGTSYPFARKFSLSLTARF